jgi:uncharacterized iron-regulated membrane protein
MRLQMIVKTTHVWIGLTLGALFCITCLSGSIVVFRPEIESAAGPKVVPSSVQADLDAAVARVLSVRPGAKLTRVALPTASRNAFVLTLESGKKTQRVVVNAGTGEVAGELNVAWLDWIVDLHHNFLAGHVGRQIVGGIGIVLFCTSGTGLLLSLLRKRSWKSMITVRTGPKRRVYFELHRATGVWIYALLTGLSFTGIALAFPDAFHTLLGKRPAIARPESRGMSFLPLTGYLTLSRTALPGIEVTELRLPKSPKDPVTVRFHEASDLGNVGRNEIAMDAAGRILGVRRPANEASGARIQGSFTPIHYAEFGGLAVKILWSVAGIAPSVLFVTGLLFWLRKSPRRDVENNAASPRELSVALHN